MAAKRGLSTELRGQKSLYYLGGLTEGTETIRRSCSPACGRRCSRGSPDLRPALLAHHRDPDRGRLADAAPGFSGLPGRRALLQATAQGDMMPIGNHSGRTEKFEVAQLARRPWTLDEFLAFDDGTDTLRAVRWPDRRDGAGFGRPRRAGAAARRADRRRSATCDEVLPRRASSRPSAPTAGTRPTSRSPAPDLPVSSSSPSRS